MAKYNIAISDYLDDLTFDQLKKVKQQAEERLKESSKQSLVKVSVVSCSLSKRQTVYVVEDKDTIEKALRLIQQWVNEDLETLPTTSWLNYEIDTNHIHPMELKEYGLGEVEE